MYFGLNDTVLRDGKSPFIWWTEWGCEGDVSCSWACSTCLTWALPWGFVADDCTHVSACPWARAHP